MRRQDEESSQEEEYEDRLSDDDEEESDEYEYDSEEYSDEDDEEDSEVESKTQPETSGSNLVDDGGTENMEKSNKNFQAKPPEMPAIPSDVSDMQPLLQKASSWGGPRSSWASIESIGSMEDGEGPVRRPRPVLRRCRTDEPRKSVSFAAVLEEIYEVAMLKMDEDPEVSHFHQLTDAQGQCEISSDASKVSQPAVVPKITMDERPSVVCSVTQASQGVSKAAGLDNTKVPETLKQSSVPQSVQPNPEQARAVDNLKPPLQRGILQPFASRSDSSTESQVQLPSNPKGPFDHHFQQSGLREGGLGYEMSQPVVNQASKVLQESPKFGNDMTDMTDTHIQGQPRIERVGSLPEPYQRPIIGILKKAKTESFVQRPKTLRFAAEVEIREISPVRRVSGSPPALTHAVVVGTPVDPGSVQWLQQLRPMPRPTEPLTENFPIGRRHSLSLLPELSDLPEREVDATGATAPSFKVQVEHQEQMKGSERYERCTSSITRSEDQSESGFLIWKTPSACESESDLSTEVQSSDGFHGISHGGIQNPFARMASYLYQITQPAQPEESQIHSPICDPLPILADNAPVLQTTVNCLNELTEMYTRHRHRSRKGHKHREKSHSNLHRCGRENIPVKENIPSLKEHGTVYKDIKDFKVDGHRLPPDFEKRVLERAYFQYINGVSEDQAYNYAEALRIELGQRPDL
eukprot:symbB.v1.2.003566.t1/scaffold204.1/size273638/15